MNTCRKVTVSVQVRFKDMDMESTDDAINIIKGVMVTTGEACRSEIEQALTDAGASDVTVQMLAY